MNDDIADFLTEMFSMKIRLSLLIVMHAFFFWRFKNKNAERNVKFLGNRVVA